MEARLTAETYEQMSFEVASEAQHVIKELSNSFWRCDPAKHEEGKTYEQVTELLQGYMENEVDLNRDGTCNNNCAYYQHAKREGCYMVGNVANETQEQQASRLVARGGTWRHVAATARHAHGMAAVISGRRWGSGVCIASGSGAEKVAVVVS